MHTTIVEHHGSAERPLETTRALVFTGRAADGERSRVATVVTPSPRAGEVTIDVEYAGINFKDVMVRRGDPGYVTEWPFVPGLEVAGRVRAVGDGVEGFRIGDRVAAYTGSGGLAEVAAADARCVVRVPDGVGMAAAAVATGVLVTAQLLLHEIGRVRRSDRVLVHGAAGGVGSAVAAVARAAGIAVLVGTVGDAVRAAHAAALGYDEVLVRDAIDPVEFAARHGGVDLILDPQGTSLLELDLALVRPGGRIILFGNASGRPLDPLPPVSRLLAQNVSIGGFSLASFAAAAPEVIADALGRTLRSFADGLLQIDLRIVEGLEGVPAIHQAIGDGRGSGKYVAHVLQG
jgi:NADPH2:quinone reductase